MKKIFIALPLLALAACNQSPGREDIVCTYSLEQNQKTCNLSEDEREDLLEDVVKSRNRVKVVDGVSYKEQDNGTLVPVQ